jgi:hypothetical protein
MTEPPSKTQILAARVAVALLLGSAVAGLIWHGVSNDDLSRLWRNVVARPGGPMTFRFVVQPAMAVAAAWRDAVDDVRLDRRPYLSAIVFSKENRGARLWEGILSTARILILGVVMDVAYQLAFLDAFHPAESAVIAILLAFLPYLLLRGPMARIARLWIARQRPAGGTTFPGGKR